MRRIFKLLVFEIVMVWLAGSMIAFAQQNPKRLIMKDGTYQSTTQWEIKGDRVRSQSAVRCDSKKQHKDVSNWQTTDKYNSAREGKNDENTKETAEAESAGEREAPPVAPGLGLPATGGVIL